MNENTDDQTVYSLLMQVMFQAKRRIHAIAEEHGLTVMQSNSLLMLSESKPLAMRELSDHFMCDASNVTGLVDRLESRGLITRQNHASDRRIKLIVLTPAGATLKAEIMQMTRLAESERMEEVLTVGERQILRELLIKLLADPR